MAHSRKANDAVPDDKPANAQPLRRVDKTACETTSPAAPVIPLESTKAAAQTEQNSSAGS